MKFKRRTKTRKKPSKREPLACFCTKCSGKIIPYSTYYEHKVKQENYEYQLQLLLDEQKAIQEAATNGESTGVLFSGIAGIEDCNDEFRHEIETPDAPLVCDDWEDDNNMAAMNTQEFQLGAEEENEETEVPEEEEAEEEEADGYPEVGWVEEPEAMSESQDISDLNFAVVPSGMSTAFSNVIGPQIPGVVPRGILDKEALAKSMRLLEIRQRCFGISEAAFEEIQCAFEIDEYSLYKCKKYIKQAVPIDVNYIDVCINSCMAFTGEFSSLDHCIYCPSREPRYETNRFRKPRKQMAVFSITSRLRLQLGSPSRVQQLKYRHENHDKDENPEVFRDIYDGRIYRKMRENGLFDNWYDFAFSASLDGFQIVKMKNHDTWAIIALNHNLCPKIRFKKENIMIIAIWPGPSNPKDYNSFLYPTIDEFKKLESGVEMSLYDGSSIIVRAYLLFVSGDIPAITKTMNLTGHNSYAACRFCYHKGKYFKECNHVFFPHDPGFEDEFEIRSHDDFSALASAVSELQEEQKQKKDSNVNKNLKEMIKKFGVKGWSEMLSVESLVFPNGFPLDFMHMVFEGITTKLFKIWIDGEFLPIKKVQEFGALMKANEKNTPSSFGRASRDIFKHFNGFKAEEWKLWLCLYSPIFLKYCGAGDKYQKGWNYFVTGVRLLLNYNGPSMSQVEEAHESFKKFYKHICLDYAGCKFNSNGEIVDLDRSAANIFTINLHYLMHLKQCILDLGPIWVYWQFPMERVCGMLLPLFRSKVRPTASLLNELTLGMSFSDLDYVVEDPRIDSSAIEILRSWLPPIAKEQIAHNDDNDPYPEVLHGVPQHILFLPDSIEFRKLKALLLNEVKRKAIKGPAVLTERDKSDFNKCQLFSRMSTEDFFEISSLLSRKETGRMNYFVALRTERDKNERWEKAPTVLVPNVTFACVHYFLSFSLRGVPYKVAYLEIWPKQNCKTTLTYKLTRRKNPTMIFMEINVIDRAVGYFEIDNAIYVLDWHGIQGTDYASCFS